MLESSTIDFRKMKKFDQDGKGTMSESSTIYFSEMKKFDQDGKKI